MRDCRRRGCGRRVAGQWAGNADAAANDLGTMRTWRTASRRRWGGVDCCDGISTTCDAPRTRRACLPRRRVGRWRRGRRRRHRRGSWQALGPTGRRTRPAAPTTATRGSNQPSAPSAVGRALEQRSTAPAPCRASSISLMTRWRVKGGASQPLLPKGSPLVARQRHSTEESTVLSAEAAAQQVADEGNH